MAGFQNQNHYRSSTVRNEHSLDKVSVHTFVPLLVPDSQTDLYFFICK